jgi:two-component system nitrate/nitrite sensor histidine kinase NarX
LLASVGRYMGMAIERAGIDEEADRLSRMEERHRLANELHDSLAQTLASLRFQVRVLDETLHQGEESAVWQELERVENSLDEAYRELRELIAQFRAPPERQGVVPSLRAVVDRLRSEGQMLVFLQNEWRDAQLPPEIETQVVRIVQEALNNARKHARAHAVRVLLRNAGEGNYHVLIEDDGVGIAEPPEPRRPGEHIGLDIMQERARRIGGELRIESEPNEGTTVTLNFRYPQGAEAPARAAARS